MTGVDIELARAALVIGLVISALLYNSTRVVSGGAVTGAYVALLALSGHWVTIGGWLVLSALGLLAIKVAAAQWPLPRNWLYAVGIIVPAVVHVIFIGLAGSPMLTDFSTYLAAGLYVTNGLTAYDAQRQGFLRTVGGVAIVAGLTYVVLVPVGWGMDLFSGSARELSAPVLQEPLTVLACIILALAIRSAYHWGTAGIIGALFFVDLLNLASIAVVVVMSVIGTYVYRLVNRTLGLTPRQRHYSILAVGAIVSWFGLFWAEYFNIPGAHVAYDFGVEPLLVIGLMIGETVRYGMPRMLAGTSIVVAVTLGVSLVGTYLPQWHWVAFLAVVVGSTVIFARAFGDVRNRWYAALAGGEQHQPLGNRPSPATE